MSEIEAAVNRAISSIRKAGGDDIFRPPFFCQPVEYKFLEDEVFRNRIRKDAERFLREKKIKSIGNIWRFAIPKNPYAYRHGSFIDIPDLTKYLSLVIMLADDIENARIERSKKAIFSNRYNRRGELFSRTYTYKHFRETASKKSKLKKFNVKVATDIANFYDRLNLHRLESSLADVCSKHEYIKFFNQLLLYWSGRNSYGLPVGCDASRILAECALIPVDNALIKNGIPFVRFVDDYRIFASNFAEAHDSLHYLIEELDKEGLFLNTSKTAFMDISSSAEPEGPEKDMLGQFQAIDESEKLTQHKRIRVGYVNRIVKHYRYPGVEKIKQLMNVDLDASAKDVNDATFESAEDQIKNFVQAFIYQGARRLDLLSEVISRYVHSITYVVDALIRESGKIDDSQKKNISSMFLDHYRGNRLSPYYKLMILRLLSDDEYMNIEFAELFLSDLSVDDGNREFLLREFCLRIKNISSRRMLNKLKLMYNGSSVITKRAIFFAYSESSIILHGEKRAWVRNVHYSEADPYIKALAGRHIGS